MREQRTHSRIDLRCPVLVTIDGVKCEGLTVNLSASGALLHITDGEMNYYDKDDDGTCCIMDHYGQTENLQFVVIRAEAPSLVIKFCDIGEMESEFLNDLLELGID